MREVIIGAVVAALINAGTALLTLLGQDGVSSLSDISQVAWATLAIGTVVSFLKDYQSITFRKGAARLGGREYEPGAK